MVHNLNNTFKRWVIHNLLKTFRFEVKGVIDFHKKQNKKIIMMTRIDIGLMEAYSNYHMHEKLQE